MGKLCGELKSGEACVVRRTVTIMMFSSFGIATCIRDAASRRELMRSNVDDVKDVGFRNVPSVQVLSCQMSNLLDDTEQDVVLVVPRIQPSEMTFVTKEVSTVKGTKCATPPLLLQRLGRAIVAAGEGDRVERQKPDGRSIL